MRLSVSERLRKGEMRERSRKWGQIEVLQTVGSPSRKESLDKARRE